MAAQLFFLADFQLPGGILAFLVQSQHPLRVIYTVLPAFVGASFLVPVVLVARSQRGARVMSAIIDRLGLLSTFYLVFDAAALVIVVIRNF
jgi:hypothetical protein